MEFENLDNLLKALEEIKELRDDYNRLSAIINTIRKLTYDYDQNSIDSSKAVLAQIKKILNRGY